MKLSEMWMYVALLFLSARTSFVYAQTEQSAGQERSVAQISISVTPGGSARLLTVDNNGSPELYDNPVDEYSWRKSTAPWQTRLPDGAVVVGLPNADVRAYASGADGVAEFRTSRTRDPWSRQIVDDRAAKGRSCAVYSGARTYVFAQRAGTG